MRPAHRYFDSAFVAMPTFVICARCSASINAINFCTGNSRSGRMTTATSGFARFNAASRAVSVSSVDRLVVELDRLGAVDRNGLHLRRIDRRIRRAARGNDEIDAVLEQRRRDHENDEQDEREIEQRRDVDLRERREVVRWE